MLRDEFGVIGPILDDQRAERCRLYAAVAAGENPASEKSQALAARWSELLRGFTGGNPEIQKGLNRMYADKANWPASMPKPFSDEVQAFIMEAMKHRQKKI